MVKVCIIGSGAMGKNHLRVLDELGADIVAIIDNAGMDKVPPKFSKKWSEFLTPDIAQSVECAIISTPTNTHNTVLSDVVSHGINNVFIEKPAAIDESHFDIENINLYIGYIERHNPAIRLTKKIISEYEIGEVKQSIFTRVGGAPRNKEQAVNVLWDLSVHDVDLMAHLFNNKPIFKSMNYDKDNSNSISTAISTYKTGDILCISHSSWDVFNKRREIKIYGTKGLLEVDLIRQKISIQRAQLGRPDPKSFIDFIFWGESGESLSLEVDKIEPLKAQLSDFLEMVKNNCKFQYSNPAFHAIKIATQSIID